ncbi:Cell pattern formation-associated protein-like protein [Hapsidospora chrysogenum ATCC 11550]|uniref:Cell pattern formation-associated protein stuA n=1 Tax=Hapsidospora chrysogenum (strain ATCC 11550 / CBS 779.69 / DSM 880 / IAM 14645 / JCM 23072 / IMI 49137) TaxID=857340 RepID=STUA_HAPC1|nr:RecName: Full=Cell pattern formation-associated protein stuA; AltName: Full=Stunted protein A [Hapsidospora chrysogenum ATCC 11550]AKR16194.1 developmental regulator StuA [Hapsidospora chrysogena]KFH45829.1 Cell pattern formation-associated protein-like protein [Hapsidospora chrysogenum ATCC 11550]
MNNGGPTEMYYQQHMQSAGQPQQPQTVTSGPMSHYPPAQPPLLQPGQPYSHGAPSPYQYGYANGMASPSGGPVPSNLPSNQPVLPLPGVGGQGAMPAHYSFDTTGQHPPPGMKPRVTATLWEDEGSLCFQVEARGICVARREDNHMINGTKLLNVAGMTRGRRDGILKSEKVRHVVKIGPMHLKGVWIPYERALDFANKEKITELLYPLFVHNIGALLYHPTNQTRTSQVMAAAERRKQDQGQMRTPPAGLPSIQHQPHNSMALPGPQSSLPSNNMARPPLDRAATFPTPPTTASSVMPNMGSTDNFNWQGQSMNGNQGTNAIAIDANLGHARSMPTTPATTPPGSMQPYGSAQSFDGSRQQMYNAPSQQSPYPASNGAHDRMYGQGNSYAKNDMGPPSSRPSGSAPSGEHEHKGSNGILPSEHGHQSHAGEEDGEHEQHDAEYTHDSGAYDSNRPSYNYTAPGVGSLAGDANNVDPSMTGSPNHPPASGRATPRTAAQPQPYYHNSGYGASPRVQQAPGFYNGVGGDRPAVNGGSGSDVYAPPADMANPMPNGYAPAPQVPNGVSGVKRGREGDDDLSRPVGDVPGMDMKRRKTLESSMPAPPFDSMSGRTAPTIGGDPRQR